ncbi:hypothetical protein [Ruminococcus sp.]|uniref:hypothetical protein n=1 Tax=Ruminococcus sp. TaxID=41978 RepID=UPI0025F67A25|nr:hypothetical protein [Ruminococcus sp.]MCI6616729.1 hypothetical protein [Ruminococcus sp.]
MVQYFYDFFKSAFYYQKNAPIVIGEIEMLTKFINFYLKLPENLQTIITGTILRMSKEHKDKLPKKRINVPLIIDYYRKKKNWTIERLMEECVKKDECFSRETYKSIMRRNIVKIKENLTIKDLIDVLEIPTDEDGNIIFNENNYPTPTGLTPITFEKYTDEYKDYIFEFNQASVYHNFNCLNEDNQKAIIYLTRSLYYNQFAPEQFTFQDENT